MTFVGRHLDGCPLARPELHDPDERPLECICADLRVDVAFDVCARLGHGEIWAVRGVCETCGTAVVQWVRVEVREGKAYTYASFEEPPLERGEAVVLPGNVVKSSFTGRVLRTVADPEADYPGPYKAVLQRVAPRDPCTCDDHAGYDDDCPMHGGLL